MEDYKHSGSCKRLNFSLSAIGGGKLSDFDRRDMVYRRGLESAFCRKFSKCEVEKSSSAGEAKFARAFFLLLPPLLLLEGVV